MFDKENEKIIILHGWGANSNRFTKIKLLLEKQSYKVYTPDLPGFGKSPLPQTPFFMDDYTAFLSKYIKDNNLKSYVLIGHSFGGRVAALFASNNPPGLKKLVLVAPSGIKHFSAKAFLFRPVAKIGSIIFKNNDLFRKILYKIAREKDYLKASPIMKQTMANILAHNLLPYLSKIEVFTLIIWGDKDSFVPVRDAYIFHREIAKSKLELFHNEGHLFPYQKDKKFVDIIVNFL